MANDIGVGDLVCAVKPGVCCGTTRFVGKVFSVTSLQTGPAPSLPCVRGALCRIYGAERRTLGARQAIRHRGFTSPEDQRTRDRHGSTDRTLLARKEALPDDSMRRHRPNDAHAR
jgi:hypothetical protein